MDRSRTRPNLIAAMLILGAFDSRDAVGSGPCGLSERPASPAFLNLPADERGTIPPLLSQTGAFQDTQALRPSTALIPYVLNTPFWSDGAFKWRWIAVPQRS